MKIENEKLYATHRDYQDTLMQLDGVYGVGIGLKKVNGELTDQLAIVVFVEKKLPKASLKEGQLVPDMLNGVPTDVYEAPRPQLATTNDPLLGQQRPLYGGVQIAVGNTLGTLGFMANTTAGVAVAVSNQHVIGAIGSTVAQPTGAATIGSTGASVLNQYVDAAYVSLAQGITGNGTVGQLTQGGVQQAVSVTGTYSPQPSDLPYPAWKTGRTTNSTYGNVTVINMSVTYPTGLIMQDQLLIAGGNVPMAQPGDSGSALMDNSNRVIGLVWGIQTGTNNAIANAITQVLSNLGLSGPVVPSPNEVFAPPAAFDWTPVAQKAMSALSESSRASPVAEFLKAHVPTIEKLLTTNDHIAVAWNRNKCHDILVTSLCNIQYGAAPLPATSYDGQDVMAALEAFGAALKKSAPAPLADEALALRDVLTWMIDKPYQDVFTREGGR